MKRKIINYLIIMSIFILLGTLFSCASSKTDDDDSNNQARIELKGNPTTGYSWFYEIEDDSVIQIEEDIKYLGSNNVVGAPSLFTYTVVALKSGSTTVKFEYKRPWEDLPAVDTKIYQVSVDDKGIVEISES